MSSMFGAFEDNENENEDYEDQRREPSNGGFVGKLIGTVLGALLFGAFLLLPVILAFGLYTLFMRVLRWRAWVTTFTLGLASAVVLLIMAVVEAWPRAREAALDWQNIGDNWSELLPLAIGSELILAFLFTLVCVYWKVRQMRSQPYITETPGRWTYKFKYRMTPLELLRRARLVKKLKSGELVREGFAPLGIDEDLNAPAGRYTEESIKHTLITGAAGSGKPLLGSTLIPTPEGMKLMRDLRAGDTVLSETGEPVGVLDHHHPHVAAAYTLRFASGTEIVAGDEHIWVVLRNGNHSVIENLTTQELHEAMATGDSFQIALVNGYTEGAFALADAKGEPREDLYELAANILDTPEEPTAKLIEGLRFATLEQRESFAYGLLASPYTVIGHGDKNDLKLGFSSLRVAKATQSFFASLGYISTDVVTNPDTDLVWFTLFLERGTAVTYNNIVAVEPNTEADLEDFYCITADSESHQYLVGDHFIPTHNTITMLSLMRADIEAGRTIVVIDFKRSPEMAAKLSAWAHEFDREFLHFVNGDPDAYDVKFSEGQCTYDPFLSGSGYEMIMNMREYDTNAEVYRTNMEQVLTVVFAMLKHADRKKAPSIDWSHGGIYTLASAISGENLDELVKACEGTEVYDNGEKLVLAARRKGNVSHQLEELQGQMRTIVSSDYGRWLKSGASERQINLKDSIMRGEGDVVLFSFNADDQPNFSKLVGSMVLTDIRAVSAHVRNVKAKHVTGIYVDEFQAVPPTALTGLLEKSRESKFAMTLAQQSFDQVISSSNNASSGEAYLVSILDTCSNFIAHAGATMDSAERLAKLIPPEWVPVYRAGNKSSSLFGSFNFFNRNNQLVQTSTEQRPRVEPAAFMELEAPSTVNNFRSTAILVNKSSNDPLMRKSKGAAAREIWMIPHEAVIDEYVEPAMVTEANSIPAIDVHEVATERELAAGLASTSTSDDEDMLATLKAHEREPIADDEDFTFEELHEDENEEFESDEHVDEEPEADSVADEAKDDAEPDEPAPVKRRSRSFSSTSLTSWDRPAPEVRERASSKKKDKPVESDELPEFDESDDMELPEF